MNLLLLKKKASPKIIVTFAMFEPKTFPKDSPLSPNNDELTETNNSGKVVETESMIKPADNPCIPSIFEILMTFSTALSLDIAKKIRLTITKTISNSINLKIIQ